MTLEAKVEYFLSNASFVTFSIREKPFLMSFIFENTKYEVFREPQNFSAVNEYFKGRKVKFVIVTDLFGTTISFVDIATFDTINVKGAKFVNGNIHAFFAAKVPENSIFELAFQGRSSDNDILIIPDSTAYPKTINIHGYSVIDKRLVK